MCLLAPVAYGLRGAASVRGFVQLSMGYMVVAMPQYEAHVTSYLVPLRAGVHGLHCGGDQRHCQGAAQPRRGVRHRAQDPRGKPRSGHALPLYDVLCCAVLRCAAMSTLCCAVSWACVLHDRVECQDAFLQSLCCQIILLVYTHMYMCPCPHIACATCGHRSSAQPVKPSSLHLA